MTTEKAEGLYDKIRGAGYQVPANEGPEQPQRDNPAKGERRYTMACGNGPPR